MKDQVAEPVLDVVLAGIFDAIDGLKKVAGLSELIAGISLGFAGENLKVKKS